MESSRLISIGKIVGTHGLKGTVKIVSYAESDDIFSKGKQINAQKAGGKIESLTIIWARPHKNLILICFKEIDSIEKCREFVGADLLIERHRLPETEDGTYYWVDLIGLSVYTTEGSYLGRLDNIFATGSNDIYVVKNQEAENLIPALESVVREIDLENRVMRVKIPEGL